MQYDDLTIMTGRLARGVAIGTFAILMTVMISYEGGIPANHVWLAVGLVAVFAHALTSTLVLPLLVSRYLPVERFADIEMSPAALVRHTFEADSLLPEPLATVVAGASGWAESVDWKGLVGHVSKPDAILSRTAISEYVDQRWYSPRDDDAVPFPVLMSEIGAAKTIAVNGTGRYIWTREAPAILNSLAQQIERGLPSPTGAGNGSVK